MKRRNDVRLRWFALALSAGAVLARSSPAQAEGGSPPLALYLEPGSDVAADEVARAVSAELGRPVRLADAGVASGRGEVLSVRSQNGVILERYADEKGRHIERELTAPQDGSARVRTIALLAGNLARNEADELVKPRVAEATSGQTEIVVRIAPGDRVRTTVETGAAATPDAPSGPSTTAHGEVEAPRSPVTVAPSPAPVVMLAEPESAPSDAGSKQRTWGWVTFASGAGLAVAGGVYAAVLASRPDACVAAAAPGGGPPLGAACSPQDAHQHVIADALLGAGALLGATGIVLVLTAPKERTGPSVAIGAAPGFVQLGGTF